MTILFITGAVLLTAAVFYQFLGYSSGEMDGYTHAVEDGWMSDK
jgi:hypothetical protein